MQVAEPRYLMSAMTDENNVFLATVDFQNNIVEGSGRATLK